MASAVIETRIVKLAELSDAILTANSAPPIAPSPPPTADARSL